MLYAIQHTNKSKLWCGPAAVAAVTGHPTDEIHRVMRAASGRTKIARVSTRLLIDTMYQFGYRMTEQIAGDDLTLTQWLKRYRTKFAKKPFIIHLTSHYVVVCGRRFMDNHTKTPVSLADAPFRRARVKRAWSFKQEGIPQVPPKPIVEVDPLRAIKKTTKALALKHGVSIEKDGIGWWVYPPEGFPDAQDPYDGEHFCEEWETVAERVSAYAQLATPLVTPKEILHDGL